MASAEPQYWENAHAGVATFYNGYPYAHGYLSAGRHLQYPFFYNTYKPIRHVYKREAESDAQFYHYPAVSPFASVYNQWGHPQAYHQTPYVSAPYAGYASYTHQFGYRSVLPTIFYMFGLL